MRLRSSIPGLMVVVPLFAVGFSALRSGSDLWFRTGYTLVVFALLVATIAARYRGPFWFGFAVVGWGYFLVVFSSLFDSGEGYHRGINQNLVTTQLLALVGGLDFLWRGPGNRNYGDTIAHIVNIGHLMLTLVFACGGGLLASISAENRP